MSPISLMQSAPGPKAIIDGGRRLYFDGTSYLGLAAHREVIEAGCEAMRRCCVMDTTRFAQLDLLLDERRSVP